MSDLSHHRRAVSFCAYCPKLCRFSCPVSNADLKESHTPWGKMTAAYHHLTEHRELDEGTGEAVYACTGCLRCRTQCRHGNEVGPALYEARAEAVAKDVAPDVVKDLKARFAPSGAFTQELSQKAKALEKVGEGRAYFPGCASVVKAPQVVKDAMDAAAGLNVPLRVSKPSSRCCGYPLWAAGLKDEFRAHAEAMAKETEDLEELVVGDPGCAYTMLRGYKEAGVELSTNVVLLVDLLADRLGQAVGRAPLNVDVSYHDACHLGRGLGRYDGPRRLLKAAAGDFTEAYENRADGGCSGGGGILPLTMPDTAVEIAKTQAAEQGAPQKAIVTACPSARRMFEKGGAEAHDLYSILARWLAAR